MDKKHYFWQPELSISIIYWSLTFIVLFYGLILTLEKTHPYLQGNIVIGISILFAVVGIHRYLYLEESGIRVRYARVWRRETLLREHIDYLTLCKDGVIIQRKGLSGAAFHFAMRKKKREAFVKDFAAFYPEIEIKANEKISRD
ncbi:EbsA family protein [Enterococcus hulanensis]|uniref:EbsA family protein n=1 Tax=Enterococcus hulanensis TaxID=2559929 RepID=A0ABU3EXZ0_9ENTE|nr:MULTISPECIES: EbsA family protein [Enterococcus]MBX8936698.1 EbsA family protein [Enterococcus gilvus]MDT2599735.1 EbsA family protein [Enterococcus hulanensis]MDT2609409.1 EbsA family protein [Enterococcus hulanensis]MDT2615986.1 EbsA family protein [Enterococcus hulanensis]MDT2627974.1 EbsA family protein [Enterococcus hulanensis]